MILGKVRRQGKWNKKALPPATNKHVSTNAPIDNCSCVPSITSCIHIAEPDRGWGHVPLNIPPRGDATVRRSPKIWRTGVTF